MLIALVGILCFIIGLIIPFMSDDWVKVEGNGTKFVVYKNNVYWLKSML